MVDYREKKISRKKVVGISVLSIILLSLIIFLLTFLTLKIIESKKNSQVTYYLNIVDDYIDNGNYFDAKTALGNISEVNKYESIQFKVLKRAYILSNKLDNYSLLLKYAKQSYESFPKKKELKSLYAYSLLRTYNYSKAHTVLLLNLTDDSFSNLLTESIIKNNEQLNYDNYISNLGKTVVDVVNNNNPKSYSQLYDIYKNPKLINNAVLYYLKDGDYETAWSLFDSKIADDNPKLGAYISYDVKEYEDALNYSHMVYYPNNSMYKKDWTLFLADINMKLDYSDKSIKIYKDFIELFPDYSYLPYFNLSLLDNSHEKAYYLSKGYKEFGDNAVLALSLANEFVNSGDDKKALKVLENFLKVEPDNIEAVLDYNFLSSNSTPERYIGILWNLYNDNKSVENERIPVSLLWFLVGLNDSNEVNRVLTTVENDYGYRTWITYYKGVLAMMNNNYQAAYDYFSKCTNEIDYDNYEFMSWEPFYNCALLSLYFNEYKNARDELDELYYLVDPDNKEMYSMIKTLSGRVYLANDEKIKALREFEIAKEANPANIEAVTYYNFSL